MADSRTDHWLTMYPERATPCEGRWRLRSGYVDQDEEIHVALVSERAPEGTLARDLTPAAVEVTLYGEAEDVALPVEVVRELITWPPGAPGQKDATSDG